VLAFFAIVFLAPLFAVLKTPSEIKGTEEFMNDVSSLAALMALASRQPIIPLNEDAHNPESKSPVFYCVHSLSGAGGADFIDLASEIGSGVRFFAIQAPKKLMLDCEKLSMEAGHGAMLPYVAKFYADAIVKFQPEGKINLGGWSAGALVALEIARLLQDWGRTVGVLVSIDGAPKRRMSARSPLHYAAKVLINIPGALFYKEFGRIWNQIARGPNIKLRIKKTQERHVVPKHPVQLFMHNWSSYPDYNQNFMVKLYDAIEIANFTGYDGAVFVYKATAQLSYVTEFWHRIAPDCVIVSIRGTHHKMLAKPFVAPLALDLNRRLNGIG